MKDRLKLSLNRGWLFHLGDCADALSEVRTEVGWHTTDLPHDWQIGQPFDQDMAGGGAQGFRPRAQVGWYRHEFLVPAEWENRVVRIIFDGIGRNGTCFINGQMVGMRPYGYVEHEYDLTKLLRYGQCNQLAVRVDNTESGHDRWYSGAGIYRNVWLLITNPTHVVNNGVRVTTPEISSDMATVVTSIRVASAAERHCRVRVEILSADEEQLSVDQSTVVEDGTSGYGIAILRFGIPNPHLWCVDSPTMYTARVTVHCEDHDCDQIDVPFGIRSAVFDKEKGFLLNGSRLKLKGVNLHHDGGCVGAAVPIKVWKRRLQIFKSMGCNAIRTSHNPPAPEFLDLCDTMGFLVVDEALDKWRWEGGYYYRLFDEWAQRDIISMIQRDFNHPSVILWSVGNEIEDQGSDRMVETLEMLCQTARREDSSRPVSCALNTHCVPPYDEEAPLQAKVSRTLLMAGKMDVLMTNYHELWYKDYHEAGLDKPLIGSEVFPYYRSMGPRFESMQAQPPWLDAAALDWVAGGFIWAGIDYFGESIAHPAKGWAACLLDTAGFRKPRSWHVESLWKEEPVLKLAIMDSRDRWDVEPTYWSFPRMVRHWNFEDRGAEMMTVAAMSNCDTVRLYLNKRLYGEAAPLAYQDRIVKWPVPFRAGELRVEGIREGKVVAHDTLHTAGRPTCVIVAADCRTLSADGQDIAHLEVSLEDDAGNPVMTGSQLLTFHTEGPLRILGVDNGDMLSDESCIGNTRRLFRGHCLAIVQAAHQRGRGVVTVHMEGLPEVQIELLVGDVIADSAKASQT